MHKWPLSLTQLSRMEFPTLINLTSPFALKGLLGVIFFHFYSIFYRTLYKHIVYTQIKRRILRRLILVCTELPMSHKKDARPIWVNTSTVCECEFILCVQTGESANWLM